MRSGIILLALILSFSTSFSQVKPKPAATATTQKITNPAYSIDAQIKPFKQGFLFLAYHFGNKQFLLDSAKIGPDGHAVFSGTKKLMGGVYMIVFPAKNGWVECMIDGQQKFAVSADTSDLIKSVVFTGSPDNTIFNDYQRKSFEIGNQINQLKNANKTNSNAGNAEANNTQITALNAEMQAYRVSIQKNNPKHLLTAIFNLLKDPTIPPASQHPGGKYDSAFAYQYYKDHYWDGISFTDERLIRTPVLQSRFDRYYDDILPQVPDSIMMYADRMLTSSRPNEEMFKFVLSSLAEKYVNPKYMGQDAVFVHLFEKYYLAGDADKWMNEKYKKFIFDRGYSMMTNVIGMKAADLPMVDTLGNNFSLSEQKAPYTVICFWDPTCGHCQQEVPKVDSIFQAKWRKEGVALIGVMTDGGKDNWLKYIREHKLTGWKHIYQTEETKDALYKANKVGYRQAYDVYQTPMIYLLDKDKHIIAKKLTYLQVDDFMEFKRKSGKQQ